MPSTVDAAAITGPAPASASPNGGRQTRCGGIEKAAEQYPAAARAQNCFVSKYIMYSAPGLKNLHWRAKEANQKSSQTNKNCVGEDTNLQALFIARQLPLSPMLSLGVPPVAQMTPISLVGECERAARCCRKSSG